MTSVKRKQTRGRLLSARQTLLILGSLPFTSLSTIWENGMKVFGAEVDDVANPYRENPGCGAIILWTRDN